MEYNNIKPVAPTSGTIVMVDSTQWTPVLMQVNDDHISIYDGKTIKKVPVIDEVTTFLLGAFVYPLVSYNEDLKELPNPSNLIIPGSLGRELLSMNNS